MLFCLPLRYGLDGAEDTEKGLFLPDGKAVGVLRNLTQRRGGLNEVLREGKVAAPVGQPPCGNSSSQAGGKKSLQTSRYRYFDF